MIRQARKMSEENEALELFDAPAWLIEEKEIAKLFAQQDDRLRQIDPRLPCFAQHVTAQKAIRTDRQELVLVAANHERLIGMAVPQVIAFPPESDMPTYYPYRKGSLQELVLCGRSAEESRAALRYLLEGVGQQWNCSGATGAEVVWPARDFSIAAELSEHSFAIDGYLAYRESSSCRQTAKRMPSDIQIRHAAACDRAAVIRLYLEVIEVHVKYSPFARHIPQAVDRFTERLQLLLDENASGDQTAFVIVAELSGEVVGIADCWVKEVSSDDNFPLVPGRYGYVNSFGVTEACRRAGVGQVLEAAVSQEFAAREALGIYLWYSDYNPSARSFWPKVGYEPLWVSYQWRDASDHIC